VSERKALLWLQDNLGPNLDYSRAREIIRVALLLSQPAPSVASPKTHFTEHEYVKWPERASAGDDFEAWYERTEMGIQVGPLKPAAMAGYLARQRVLGEGQIELASLLCEEQRKVKELTAELASAGEPAAQRDSSTCPTCASPAYHLHPKTKDEGNVVVCKDAWHRYAARATAAPASTPAVRLTLEDAIYIPAYAAEGRMNTIKPDLLANVINKLIAQRASRPTRYGARSAEGDARDGASGDG